MHLSLSHHQREQRVSTPSPLSQAVKSLLAIKLTNFQSRNLCWAWCIYITPLCISRIWEIWLANSQWAISYTMYGHYKLTIEVEKTFFYTEIKIKTSQNIISSFFINETTAPKRLTYKFNLNYIIRERETKSTICTDYESQAWLLLNQI